MPFAISVYNNATHLLRAEELVFRQHPDTSNIIYAHAVKTSSADAENSQSPNFWVVARYANPSSSTSSVAFVLSCTTGPLGDYPIFIFTPLSNTNLHDDFTRTGILAMIDALREQVPPERVFSVFAIDALADTFAKMWTAQTGIELAENPVYYHAEFLYCNQSTFQSHGTPYPPRIDGFTSVLRPAVDSDLPRVALLCHGFAAESEPFILSCEDAEKEAGILIKNHQLWVYEVGQPNQELELASIVAVTRATDTIAAITKVYTNPNWRKRGCAESLIRHVCQQLLGPENKQSVVLYVGHDNPAGKMYRRAGFVGVESLSPGMTDSWKELGFDRSKVDLGHW